MQGIHGNEARAKQEQWNCWSYSRNNIGNLKHKWEHGTNSENMTLPKRLWKRDRGGFAIFYLCDIITIGEGNHVFMTSKRRTPQGAQFPTGFFRAYVAHGTGLVTPRAIEGCLATCRHNRRLHLPRHPPRRKSTS